MSNNDRQGRQSVASDASVQGDSASLLDAIFSVSQAAPRSALGEGEGGAGNRPQLLVPFPHQQQQGLPLDPTVDGQSLTDLQRSGFQNLLTLSNLRNLQAQAPQYNGFNQADPNLSFQPPTKTPPVPASLAPPFSTSLPPLASPQQTTSSNKLHTLRLAIATRDPSESVEDVLSPRSLSYLHNHFQSMGLDFPASASWGQIQQLLEAPRPNMHPSPSGQDGAIGGVPPQQDSSASLLSSFPAVQDNNQWNDTQGAGTSVLDRFMASVNLPANEANARIKKLAANLILQQQQQQKEQQRLLRQQQLRQLQESFQLHAQIPPLPSFQQQPGQTSPALANLQGLLGNANLGASQDALRSGHLSHLPSLSGLPNLTPQMNELLQAALSKNNPGGMGSFLDTQKYAVSTLQQLAQGGQQPPVPDQVAQVIVGQRPPARRPGAASAAFEPGFQGQQNLASLVAPLTSDAMRKALMAGGALSGQPAESAGGSQGSVRTGKRGVSFRGDSQQTSLEEASAESSPTERKRPRQQGFSPQPSSKLSYGAIPRAPTFNNRVSQVTIPPLPPIPNLQFQSPLSLPPVPGIARPTKTSTGAYSFQSPGGGSMHLLPSSGEQKAQAHLLAEAVRRGDGIGAGAEVDKGRGESTPVKANRAKRGEATDKHSVAERVRRERLQEKMTELFGLVPHRHKKDKATMLEEIIEYVKMMQLQVQVLSVGPQLTAQSAQDEFPGGLPAAATRGGGGPSGGSGLAAAAAAAPRFTSQLQRSPEQAVRFLLDRGLCLVPAHLAAKLLDLPPEELTRRPTSARPSARDSGPAAPLQGSPMMTSPSELEGARAPAAVFSGWEEEEDQAAAKVREDAREIADALRDQEQREARSESGLASSGGMNVDNIGRTYRRSVSEEEQAVDQLPTMQSGEDFNAMSPGLGEGLDLPGFGKVDPMVEGGRMSWDSDPHV